jgi:hypothetical protein
LPAVSSWVCLIKSQLPVVDTCFADYAGGLALLEALSSLESQVLSVTRPARYLSDFHPDPAWRQAASDAAMIVTAALQRARAHPALGPALAAVAEKLQEMRVAADDDETEGEAGRAALVEGWLRVAERYRRECDRCGARCHARFSVLNMLSADPEA